MQATKLRPGTRRGGVIWLPVDELEPSPVQPRKNFPDGELQELSESIAQYGVLNPLTVRLRDSRYELVAGERRLRAARLAGLCDVPCILLDVSLEDASLIALVENLQRRDLDFIEEANGLSQLIKLFGMSQEEAARRIGKSQSAVANKLRLLKLPEDVLASLRASGLTERHVRARIHDRARSQRRSRRRVYRVAPARARGEARPEENVYHEGCARFREHHPARARPHEAGRHRRRNEARGDRQRADTYHFNTQKQIRIGHEYTVVECTRRYFKCWRR